MPTSDTTTNTTNTTTNERYSAIPGVHRGKLHSSAMLIQTSSPANA